MRYIPFLVLFFILHKVDLIKGQNYSYSFSTENETFAYLPNDSSVQNLNEYQVWDDNTYAVPLGFSFNFAGNIFDTVKIGTNGVLTFDNDSKFNFSCLFKNFICETNDQALALSNLKSQIVSQENGNKILKIEFQNVYFILKNGEKKHLNFQVWLFEGLNSIEFRMGDYDVGIIDEFFIIGPINMNFSANDAAIGALLKNGNSTPILAIMNRGEKLPQINTLPASGSVLKFFQN